MKSNKQRKLEIKAKRLKRAEAKKANAYQGFISFNTKPLEENAVEANHSELTHNHPLASLPLYYVDKPFKCRDCGCIEVWTASRQKWWYEVAKGLIESTAIRCRACRIKKKIEKEQQKTHREVMAKKTPHPNEVFFRKQY